MSEKIDLEIEAIRTILKTLQDLDEEVRRNVIEYVLRRVGFTPNADLQQKSREGNEGLANVSGGNILDEIQHIKQFKESKQPKSAQEMAILIAYYLQYVAEEDKRKDKVGVSDLQTWFRIADYPLPTGDMRFVLVNAKNAGYLDSVGSGEYKLNAIGYNLVKHNLPRQDKPGAKNRTKTSSRKSVAKKASKKTAKKK